MQLFVWRLGNIFPSKTTIFTIAADKRNLLKSNPITDIFLKMFNIFEKSRFISTKQLWTSSSVLLVFHKKWGCLMQHIFVGRKNTWTSKLFVIFFRCKCHEFPPPRGVESTKIKMYTLFFMSNSIFHLCLRLLREDINFMLKVAKKLHHWILISPQVKVLLKR